MKRWLPFPLLWLLLLLLWLLLNQTLWVGHVLLGGVLAAGACHALRRLRTPREGGASAPLILRRAGAAATLSWHVAVDIVRSNIAVARIVLHRGTRKQTAGFLEIPLALHDPLGLALLACIITATPGTAWARYEGDRGVLTLHILDLVDEEFWIATIKGRYESRLIEIFEE
jgi:multicomponent K+:H+ antiporter subunit E